MDNLNLSEWSVVTFLSTYIFSILVDFGRAFFEFSVNFLSKRKEPRDTLWSDEVAIVIPCCNSEKVIENTISTLNNQYKVFCVVNNCTDRTREKLEKIQLGNDNIEILESEGRGKIRAVLVGALTAKARGFSHFLLLDDDVEWPNLNPIHVYNKDIPITALPVLPTRPTNWIHAEQAIEYQFMCVSKRAQSLLGDTIMVSGAAGIYKINNFLEAVAKHDGEHIGDDLQCSYIHHTVGFRIDFFPETLVGTKPPKTLKKWWKQRAGRWEVSPIYNVRWVLKTIFGSLKLKIGWWIGALAGYRFLVSFNDVVRCISLPFVLWHSPVSLLGVFMVTYACLVLKSVSYFLFFPQFRIRFNLLMILSVLTFPLYTSLMWLSRMGAMPRGIYLNFRKRKNLGKFINETYESILKEESL